MSLREMVEHPPAFSDLPVWRKIVLIAGLAFSMLVTAAGAYEHVEIYGEAPDHPVAVTGQTYAVNVMHGYIRYVTLEQYKAYLVWAQQAGPWAGAAFFVAFFTLITYSKKARSRH